MAFVALGTPVRYLTFCISRIFPMMIFLMKIRNIKTQNFDLQFVATTQPINALAFIFDGLFFGSSDFSYAALSMVIYGWKSFFLSENQNSVSNACCYMHQIKGTYIPTCLQWRTWVCLQIIVTIISSGVMFLAESKLKFIGIWVGLTVLMTMRMLTGFLRYLLVTYVGLRIVQALYIQRISKNF